MDSPKMPTLWTMRTVLIADDEPDVRLMLRTVLVPQGWNVVDVSSGAEAMEVFGRERFDAVVLDYKMPGVSGLDVAAAIVGEGSAVPIILYSAYLTTEIVSTAGALGIRIVNKADLQELTAALSGVADGAA